MNQQSRNDEISWRNLIAACAAICVVGFAFGLTYPLLSLTMNNKGISSDIIGWNAAMMPIGILLASGMIPTLADKIGTRRLAILAAIGAASSVIGFKIFDNLSAWFFLRLFLGMCNSTLFALSESWIVQFSGDKHRGRMVAIYAVSLSASFGLGPLLLSIVGVEGWIPFVTGALIVALAIYPLSIVDLSSIEQKDESTHQQSVFSFIPLAPILLLSVLAFGFFDAATLALLPVYGKEIGFTDTTSANLLTALVMGNVLLQLPIGWLADKISKRFMLFMCGVLTSLTFLALPFVWDTFWIWPAVIIGGSTGFGMYTVALSSLGDRFKGKELVLGTASFASAWGIGALIGSAVPGGFMNSYGPQGLPATIVVMYLIYLMLFALRLFYQTNKK